MRGMMKSLADLTPDEVRAIRRARADGKTYVQILDVVWTPLSNIARICRREVRTDVPEEPGTAPPPSHRAAKLTPDRAVMRNVLAALTSEGDEATKLRIASDMLRSHLNLPPR